MTGNYRPSPLDRKGNEMGKLIRCEFLGNKLVLLILCIFLFPLGIVYFLQCAVIVEEQMEKPSEFLEKWKSGEIKV